MNYCEGKRAFCLILLLTVFSFLYPHSGSSDFSNPSESSDDLVIEQHLRNRIRDGVDKLLSNNYTEREINRMLENIQLVHKSQKEKKRVELESRFWKIQKIIDVLDDIKGNLEMSYNHVKGMINYTQNLNKSIEKMEKSMHSFRTHLDVKDEILKSLKRKKEKRYQTITSIKNIDEEMKIMERLNNFSDELTIFSDGFFNEIEEEKNDIRNEIGTIVDQLERNEYSGLSLKCLNVCFKTICSTIESLSASLSNELKQLLEREFVVIIDASIKGDPHKSVYENFQHASSFAYSKLRKKMISKFVELNKEGAGLDDVSNFSERIKIIDIEVPVLFQQTKKKFGALRIDYTVCLKARITFGLDVKSEKKKNFEYYFDCVNNIIWTEDIGDYVVYEKPDGNDCLLAFLSQLNEKSKEGQSNDRRWEVVSKDILEKVLQNKRLFRRLNIRLDRNYWGSEKRGMYINTYEFKMDKNGKMRLITEERINSDGAYCLFVKKLEGEE